MDGWREGRSEYFKELAPIIVEAKVPESAVDKLETQESQCCEF